MWSPLGESSVSTWAKCQEGNTPDQEGGVSASAAVGPA